MVQWLWKEETGRGRLDFKVKGSDFNPPVNIGETSAVWATATEVNGTHGPINGGAHVIVQQVVPAQDNSVAVRVWVDNVPVNITVRLTVFFDGS